MPSIEMYENLVVGSGGAGKLMAWTIAGAGRHTALIKRAAFEYPSICVTLGSSRSSNKEGPLNRERDLSPSLTVLRWPFERPFLTP